MAVYRVFHYAGETLSGDARLMMFSDAAVDFFPERHVHVADVECVGDGEDGLGEAFEKTNTIDQAWWLNDGVTLAPLPAAAGGCRSTSVGDVIVDPQGIANGVLGVGFKRLEKGPDSHRIPIQVVPTR